MDVMADELAVQLWRRATVRSLITNQSAFTGDAPDGNDIAYIV